MNVGSHQLGGAWQGNKAAACLRNADFHLKPVASYMYMYIVGQSQVWRHHRRATIVKTKYLDLTVFPEFRTT